MSETKPADLTLVIQKAAEGFTAIVDRPTYNNILDICQILLPVLMITKYDEIDPKHNLFGVILPTDRYEKLYGKGPYELPPRVLLYSISITKYATRTEVIRPRNVTKQSATNVPSMRQ